MARPRPAEEASARAESLMARAARDDRPDVDDHVVADGMFAADSLRGARQAAACFPQPDEPAWEISPASTVAAPALAIQSSFLRSHSVTRMTAPMASQMPSISGA
jgi:hypothetical protein